ncbi:MAG: serine/threonine protein kinase [Verrucomicrobiaceae bacterium]|nr:serine/threonine protein kinase [Verrucomicrobiaceae bacterium]
MHSLIARGGMGAVYRAFQRSLGRTVAVKVLPALLREADAGYAERFQQEARTIACLSHPGIIGIHEAGELQDGSMYFAMEHLQGSDLGKKLAAQGRLDAGTVLRLGIEICEALQAAHERGIIHRDIKPTNIMLSEEGRIKIADFGLASTPQSGELELTRTNFVMGTSFFVAPELLLGCASSVRSDLYALGVTLYQLLTGQIPQGAFLPPSQAVPGLDRRWDDIILQALQTDPAQRQADAEGLRQQLQALTLPAPRTRSLRWLFAAGLACIGFIITAAWWSREQPAPSPQAPTGTVPRVTNLLNFFDLEKGTPEGGWRHSKSGFMVAENLGKPSILSTHFPVVEEYDYEIEFTAHHDTRETFVSQVFEVNGHPVEWSLNVSPLSRHPYHSFLRLDGKETPDTPEVRTAQPAHLNRAQRYRSLVQVRREGLRALLDGQIIVDWRGDARRFARSNLTQWPAGHIGFLAWNGGVTFHKKILTEHLRRDSAQHFPVLKKTAPGEISPAQPPPLVAAKEATSTTPSSSLQIDLRLEDDAQADITLLWAFNSQNIPIGTYRPGRHSIARPELKDGFKHLKIRSSGHAMQTLYMNGHSMPQPQPICLYRSRYVIMRVTHIGSGQRQFAEPGLRSTRVALSHYAAPENLGSFDWQIVQAGENSSVKGHGGPHVWLRFHHHTDGYGIAPARAGESYETMIEAPAEGYSTRAIRPSPGMKLYYRNIGNGTTDHGYGKLEIEAITEIPPADVTIITPIIR